MKNDLQDIYEYIDQATDAEKENLIRVIDVIRSSGDVHDQFVAWLKAKDHVGKSAEEVAAFLDSIGA